MNKISNDIKGSVGILTAIVLGSVLTILAVTILLTGISSRNNALILNQSEQVFIPLEGCADNTLILLKRDNSYSGGSYTVDGVNCTAAINGTDNERDIAISAEKGNIRRDLAIRVQLKPEFGIIEWNE